MKEVAKGKNSAISILIICTAFLMISVMVPFSWNHARAITITVDDSGGADYLTIQEAVNAANPGDTIYVYNGIYVEDVYIDKTLTLMGEGRNETIIEGVGSLYATVVIENTDYVNMTGFTIICPSTSGSLYDLTLFNSSECSISNNEFWGDRYGVLELYNSSNNKISNNIINSTSGGNGIQLAIYSSYNLITGNDIFGSIWNASIAIDDWYTGQLCEYNQVFNNTLYYSYNGIYVHSPHNAIAYNEIWENENGIRINGDNNLIYHNSVINNTIQAEDWGNNNLWNLSYPEGGNYWSDYTGNDFFYGPNQNLSGSDGIGDTPYPINGGSDDYYPLMLPYNGSYNNPPIITTWPVYTAKTGVLYSVEYEAYDFDGDSLTWYLSVNAAWLSIDNVTGVLSGIPSISDVGDYWVNVSVDDGRGGVDSQYFTLTVIEKSIINLDTMEEFWDIQEAIDDPDTQNGHTIWVGEGYYEENVVINKSITLVGENKDDTYIDGRGEGDAVRIIVDYVNITNFTITEGGHYNLEGAGIAILSDFNNVSGNVFEDNRNAIFLYPSANDNIIEDNLIYMNSDGIWLNSSSDNHIHNNNIFANWGNAITLSEECFNNHIVENTLGLCEIGLYLYDSWDNYIGYNNFGSNDWINIRLFHSDNNKIEGNSISSSNDKGTGLSLHSSDFNNITGNDIEGIDIGIDIYYSLENIVTRNNISNCSDKGIYVSGSANNLIYHNNFKDNTAQAIDIQEDNNWDNGYPSGGNYWNDYGGFDNFTGVDQDIPGSDGIGDSPYSVYNNWDNYPLMFPWEVYVNLDISPPSTTDDYDGLWHTSDFTITLTAVDESSGINETYYRINNGTINTVSSAGHPIITIEGDNNTLEYWSVDNAGNEEVHVFLYNIKLDKTLPSSIDDYDGSWHYEHFIITIHSTDTLSGVDDIFYVINNGAIQSVNIDGQPMITTEGDNNSLEYWSVDVAGNTEVHHLIWDIKLNKTYPDLTVSSQDIIFSKLRLIEGNEIYINATIHNIGNLSTQAQVNFYDGEPLTGSLIGSKSVFVPAQSSILSSVKWNATLGEHILYIVIEGAVPAEPYIDNNIANISASVEVRPVLILSVGDINIFRFESGEERTVPVTVSCYNNSANNVQLTVLDNRGLNITVVTPPQDLSKDQSFVFYLRIKAPVLKEKQKYQEEDILLQAVSDEVSSNEESMDVLVGREAADFLGLFLLIGGIAAGAGAVGILGGTEIGKYALFAAAMSLYTRLTRDDVMDQETRGMIRGYIMANPGEHYNAIKRSLGLKNGTLAYHLKTLERENMVKSTRDGRYKRFYPAGMKIPDDVFKLNKIQELIMGEIINNPGISQKELAEAIGLSTSTINYHIGVMVNSGYVRVERKGKYTQCHPGNGVP